MFSGFRSLCTSFFSCRYFTALQMSPKSRAAYRDVYRPAKATKEQVSIYNDLQKHIKAHILYVQIDNQLWVTSAVLVPRRLSVAVKGPASHVSAFHLHGSVRAWFSTSLWTTK